MFSSQFYCPALRLKQAEYTALADLGASVNERIIPYLILPPHGEPDPEKGRPLTKEELVPEGGQRIGRHWPEAPCFADARFLFDSLDESEREIWLPSLIKIANDNHGSASPVATLEDIDRDRAKAFVRAGAIAGRGVAIRLGLADLDDSGVQTRLRKALGEIGQKAEQTVLFMDLSAADTTDVDAVSDYMISAFQRMMDVGLWQRVVVMGTSYPETNPASNAGEILFPRNDWLAWMRAAQSDPDFERLSIFGDFAADSAKFEFRKGGGMPIGHYRYSTEREWFVVRADAEKPTRAGMREVCEKIESSSHFAGHSFSRGDAYIAECAVGNDGPGTAVIWRWANTVHHLTRVTADLGLLKGYRIPLLPRRAPSVQQDMFHAK